MLVAVADGGALDMDDDDEEEEKVVDGWAEVAEELLGGGGDSDSVGDGDGVLLAVGVSDGDDGSSADEVDIQRRGHEQAICCDYQGPTVIKAGLAKAALAKTWRLTLSLIHR